MKFAYAKELKLSIGFTDKHGKGNESEQVIDLTFADCDDFSEDNKAKMVKREEDFCESVGIRKVRLLCQYIDILKEWVEMDTKLKKMVDEADDALFVSDGFRAKFAVFAKYFEAEMNAVHD